MNENKLEELAKRVQDLEAKVDLLSSRSASPAAIVPPQRDWREVVGMFEGSEFMRQVDAEVEAMRQADRLAALNDCEP